MEYARSWDVREVGLSFICIWCRIREPSNQLESSPDEVTGAETHWHMYGRSVCAGRDDHLTCRVCSDLPSDELSAAWCLPPPAILPTVLWLAAVAVSRPCRDYSSRLPRLLLVYLVWLVYGPFGPI